GRRRPGKLVVHADLPFQVVQGTASARRVTRWYVKTGERGRWPTYTRLHGPRCPPGCLSPSRLTSSLPSTRFTGTEDALSTTYSLFQRVAVHLRHRPNNVEGIARWPGRGRLNMPDALRTAT